MENNITFSRHACDRKKPSCSRCYRRGITCVYPEAAPTLKKLQKATETLGDRIKKFGDRLKTGESPISSTTINDYPISPDQSEAGSPCSGSVFSTYSGDGQDLVEQPKRRRRGTKVASTSHFSVYPCAKCFKDLQQCDLNLPRCGRCQANNFECSFKKTEPKANHVSQVLTTMNRVMDQWQESIDRMAKDFAQKTKDLSARANQSLKIKPIPQPSWKITTTQKGLSVESNVNSYNDLSKLVDQFKKSMTITPTNTNTNTDDNNLTFNQSNNTNTNNNNNKQNSNQPIDHTLEFDDASSVHTTSGFSFAIWNSWAHPTHAMPQDYPIDISQELTDNLIDLYCRAPCCSSIRLPIIDVVDFQKRYYDPNPKNQPSKVLVYAICAMAARNAFQLHVWCKRPSHEAPQYNMGKALSLAYCLKGRELLSECFDEPTFDNCQAAFLLSYCNHQNGYPGVIYIYGWIAYNMAQELGLYDPNRQLNRFESMLVWCIYYCNTWYRLLQVGGSSGVSAGLGHIQPPCPLPKLLSPPLSLKSKNGEPCQEAVDYYVWNTWVYLIKLQILRDECMQKLLSYQDADRNDNCLPEDLINMQAMLQEFHDKLPSEWQQPDITMDDEYSDNQTSSSATPCSPLSCPSPESSVDNSHYSVDIKQLSNNCINLVNIYYCINQIILHQAFVPMDRLPSTPISLQCLQVSLNAANNISEILGSMVQRREDCSIPLLAFLFANIVYRKALSFSDTIYRDIGRLGLVRSLEISKASINFTYDFEMARTLVTLIEEDVNHTLSVRKDFMFTDSSVSSPEVTMT